MVGCFLFLLTAACTHGLNEPRDPVGTDDSGTFVTDSREPREDDSGVTDDSTVTDTGEIVTIDGVASVRNNPHNPFSAFVQVTADHDASVVVEYGENDFDHQTPPLEVLAGEPTDVLVLGLRAGRPYELRVQATHNLAHWTSDPLAYTTAPLPNGWPTCTPTFNAPEDTFSEDEVVCTQGTIADGHHIYSCMDHWGEPVFLVRTAGDDSLMSMEPLRDGSWASTSFNNSKVAFFDRTSNETGEYAATYFDGDTRFTHEYIDSHELYQIPSGKWAGAIVFLTDAYEYFADKSYKLGNGLIVFDPVSREVLYDYSFHGTLGDQVAASKLLPYSRAGIGDFPEDWNHANTVLHATEDSGREYFLISLKAQDWIVKLYPDTDELAWALGNEGNFTLVDDLDASSPTEMSSLAWEYHQHGVVFLDDVGSRVSLFMFDNGYPRHGPMGVNWDLTYSRIVELQYDETSMLADLDFVYGPTSGEDWFFSSTCGNAFVLPDGDRAMAMNGESATMMEVSYPEGERLWSMQCETRDWCSYRVQWFPSMYETTWMYE